MSDYTAFFDSLQSFGIRPGLERVSLLCERLGNPQEELSFIHVAGTNGKGSVCEELYRILLAAGQTAGMYTSPHVADFRERIQINGAYVAEELLAECAGEVRSAVEALNADGVVITEFEAITAAAFLCFRKSGVRIVVLETGLGGRFDATNIISSPLVSVITSVSFDHTAVLGDTIEKIAFEKAGIIKPGRPVVTPGSQHPDALRVISGRARELGSEFICVPAAFRLVSEDQRGSVIRLEDGAELAVPFPGTHQRENTLLVNAVCSELTRQGLTIDKYAVDTGLRGSFLPARTQIVSEEPLVVLDGGHNDGASKALAAYLTRFFRGRKILAVVGMMKDKDVVRYAENVAPCLSAVVATRSKN
nr:bifunctional folylpolyglutamate synthase/dihydrofolate synthase [Clostridia bacterium]